MSAPKSRTPAPHSRPAAAKKAVELATESSRMEVGKAIGLAEVAAKDLQGASEAVQEDATYAIDTLQMTARDTLRGAEGMLMAVTHVVDGLTEVQQTMWSTFARAFQSALDMPVELASCKDLASLALKQRNFMSSGFDEWLNVSHDLLMTSRRITDRAINSLEPR